MSDPDKALESCYALGELARRGGHYLTDFDLTVLQRTLRTGLITWRGGIEEGRAGELTFLDALISPDLSDKEVAGLSRVTIAAFRGFFDAAADGLPLVAVSNVTAWRGRTADWAYPGAGDAFCKFATTYWTLDALVRDCVLPEGTQVAVAALERIARIVGPLFFPTEADSMDPYQRAKRQKHVLGAFSRRINPAQFVAGNPSLRR